MLADRYLAYDTEYGWELATGECARVSAAAPEEDTPPFAPLLEVLDHGREAVPRWVTMETADAEPLPAIRRAAADARARGYVAVAVALYRRLGDVLHASLQDRTLLLIAAPDVPEHQARAALVDAAARTPRPHVLLSLRTRRRGPVHTTPGLWIVREARAAYAPDPPSRRAAETMPEDVARHVRRGARAAALVQSGRHAAAERLLRDVTACLARRRAFAAAARSSIALGQVLLERGRADAADTAFADAAEQAEAVDDEALACEARVWQAAARTDGGRLSAAESLVRAALVCGVLNGGRRAQAQATLTRVLLWQGRSAEAAAVELDLPSPDDEALPFVAATRVRVLIERGDVFTAGQLARSLVEQAQQRQEPAAVVMACVARLRVLIAAGDLVLAEAGLADVARAARAARTPLRLVRARLLWHDALVRAGRTQEAAGMLRPLRRLRAVLPPLLRAAIDRRAAGPPAPMPAAERTSVLGPAAALIGIAQGEEHDADAIRRILETATGTLHASRADLCSADAGPVSIVMSVGAGLPTRLGSRVLDAGIDLGPEGGEGGCEIGVPVRLGSRLVGAIVVRWPADRRAPDQARELIALAAAAAAPRVDAMRAAARETSRASTLVPELVGTSAAIEEVRRAVARAAGAPFAVLIEGESGVGKELVARAIHQLGPRRERRFCDVNCAALPDELLESELFGHARGAFTGAVSERAGLFEDADGGTLFLDEVADLSPRAQAKLLRVLQQQEVRRVGETFSRRVDVRIVSAANREMRVEAADQRFRQDLLYRLDVIRVRIPPLRERPEDVALLAAHFWRSVAPRVGTTATLTHPVLTALTRYHWPGNVRELQNVMAALAVAAPARGHVKASLLPAAVTSATSITAGRLAEARTQFERRFVEVALARAGGRRAQAARELGISRQGLLKMLERHGLT